MQGAGTSGDALRAVVAAAAYVRASAWAHTRTDTVGESVPPCDAAAFFARHPCCARLCHQGVSWGVQQGVGCRVGRSGGRRIRRRGQRGRRHAASGPCPSVDGRQGQGCRHATSSSPFSSARAAATRRSVDRRQGHDSRRSVSSSPSTTTGDAAALRTSNESDAGGAASAATAAAAAAAWLAPICEEGREETERGPGGRQVWLCVVVRGR